MDTLHFRHLVADDYPLLLQWLSLPHVKEWWDDGDDTLEKVARHFTSDPDTVYRFILEQQLPEQAPIPLGYFQYYLEADGSIGIDQFIGNPDFVGKGYGSRALKQFCELIQSQHTVSRLIIDPHPNNKRAIRCYEKAGFTHERTYFSEETCTHVYLMARMMSS